MSNNKINFARMKFYCDENRCIHCDGCSVACSSAHDLPVGISRRKVITVNEGKQGMEFSLSVACMHCTDAPCEQVCPVDCFYIRDDGIVLHDKDKCIGCSYCLYACPFGAPQFPKDGAFGTKELWTNVQCVLVVLMKQIVSMKENFMGKIELLKVKSSYVCCCLFNKSFISWRC